MKFVRILKKLHLPILCAVLLPIASLNTSCGLVGAGVGTALSLLPLKLMFNCLPEGTTIDTPNGTQTVETLRPGDVVIGFSGRPVKVIQVQGYLEDDKADNFLKIEFADGAVVDMCKQHRIHGIRAGSLEVGDEIKSGQVVKSIAVYGGVERSYDILTEDKGYRIGGVPVNSMIEEMYETGRTGKIKE